MKGKLGRWIRIALFALLAALVILCALLWQQYDRVRTMQNMPRGFSGFMYRHSLPLTNAGAIQSWMTFDYLDHVFALDPSQLQTQLAITDPRYPRLSISAWAHETNQPISDALARVQAEVGADIQTPAQSQ